MIDEILKTFSDLGLAEQILHFYELKNEPVDEGNLFFAATEYQKAFDRLAKVLEKCMEQRDYYMNDRDIGWGELHERIRDADAKLLAIARG